eukprot:UN31122
MTGKLVVPEFRDFCDELEEMYRECKRIKKGHRANYIKALANQDPKLWAIAVCTTDGQEYSKGHVDYKFCAQSCSAPIVYMMASQEHGFDKVHQHIGREPSGKDVQELVLKELPSAENPERQVPHNPMVNAGCIACCSLLSKGKPMVERFRNVMDYWKHLCGSNVSFSNEVYLSEKAASDRNWCLGYMMQEYDSFPKGTKLNDTLELYFQQCSIEVNVRQLGMLAATMANGGTHPKTGHMIIEPC